MDMRPVAYALLGLPFVAVLWVPLYGRTTPRLAGLPFFYWYQFVWIVLTVALMAISARMLRRADRRDQ
jgi:membrane protein implicated in regulation of membrane protease activity